jgi:hypothetical protein
VDPAIVLPLVLAALIAVLLALFLQRASGALRATRRVERFQEEAAELGKRLDAVLASTIARVDAVRRHEVDGGSVLEELDAILSRLDGELVQAEGLAAPAVFSASRLGIIAEIRHAQRALDMVQHGCALAAGPRARTRNTESQISIKRGYLNLLHAREALARHVSDLAAARDPMESSWRTSRT